LGFVRRSKGFEVARYDYSLTDDGMAIAEEKARLHPMVWAKIKTAIDRLKAA